MNKQINYKQEKIDRLLFLVEMMKSGDKFYIDDKEVYFSLGGAICSKDKMVNYEFNRLIADTEIQLRETKVVS
jgi:hypothetical protein